MTLENGLDTIRKRSQVRDMLGVSIELMRDALGTGAVVLTEEQKGEVRAAIKLVRSVKEESACPF